MKLILRHDLSLLPPDAIDAFINAFAGLLEQIVETPNAPIRSLIGDVRKAAQLRPTSVQTTAYAAPQTAAEEQLAEIWAEVLKREKVGRTDNFFETGGHSLLAVKVINRLRAAFDLDLSVRALFDRPVLADLATHIDALRATAPPTDIKAEMEIEF